LEGVKLLLMLFGRGVGFIRGWGQLVLGDEGARRIVKKCSILLRGLTYSYVLLAGLKVIAYY
jgi:hypothetical protein